MKHSPAISTESVEKKPVQNLSGIIPMQYKLVVEVEKSLAKTAGGILVPEGAQDRQQFEVTRGTIVGIGPAAFTDTNQYPEGTPRPQLGDRIWFDKHAGTQMKAKRDRMTLYRVIEDTDVTGICQDEEILKELVA